MIIHMEINILNKIKINSKNIFKKMIEIYNKIITIHTNTPTITILHRTIIRTLSIIIVIEIIKRNMNKTIKTFKYTTIRTSHNLTTIWSSS